MIANRKLNDPKPFVSKDRVNINWRKERRNKTDIKYGVAKSWMVDVKIRSRTAAFFTAFLRDQFS